MTKKKVDVQIDNSYGNEERVKCAKLFAVGWTVPGEKITEYSGLSVHQIKDLEERGYIQKVSTRKTCFYKPTDYGQAYFEAASGHRCTRTSHETGKHNYAVIDVYLSRDEDEQDSWKTEADLQKYARDHKFDFDEISCTDGSYLNSETGEVEYFEIETKHYTEAHIAKKVAFAEKMGGRYDPVKI